MKTNLLDLPEAPAAPPVETTDVSVIIYVDKNLENAAQMYAYVANTLTREEKSFEFIFVDDGNSPRIYNAIEGLQAFAQNAKVIRLPRFYGPSIAMVVGFRHAKGELILTLGSFLQIQPSEIQKMFRKIEEGFDFVNGWRSHRNDTRLNQLHTRVYNWLVRKVLQVDLHDTNCTLKLFKKDVAQQLPMYGDYYRFFPVMAARQGYRVTEVPVDQRRELNRVGIYSAGIYFRRALDLLAVLFMGRFIRKPLRFFGLIGSTLFVAGVIINLYLVYVKYGVGEPIAARPLLILGTLLMTLGVQTGSIGLLGELILFTHSDQIKDYQIETILE